MNKYDCSKCLDYLHEQRRMCAYYVSCSHCDLWKNDIHCVCKIGDTQAKIDIVQKWSNENPEQSEKTILEDFKEKYPNYQRNDVGTPSVCANFLYCGRNSGKCHKVSTCKDCWNRPLSEIANVYQS